MYYLKIWSVLYVFVVYLYKADSVELTFELADNAKECFYQEIEKNVSSTLEFQVGNDLIVVYRICNIFLLPCHHIAYFTLFLQLNLTSLTS